MAGIYQGVLGAVSHRAHWTEPFELVDDETDELIILGPADEVEVWVTREDTPDTAVLYGSRANGIVIISDTGAGHWTFGPAAMSTLDEGTHRVFARATVDGVVHQVLAADLPVINGGPE